MWAINRPQLRLFETGNRGFSGKMTVFRGQNTNKGGLKLFWGTSRCRIDDIAPAQIGTGVNALAGVGVPPGPSRYSGILAGETSPAWSAMPVALPSKPHPLPRRPRLSDLSALASKLWSQVEQAEDFPMACHARRDEYGQQLFVSHLDQAEQATMPSH